MKHAFLFLTGASGSGKGYFWENYLRPTKKFNKLVSATARKPREGEQDGVDYYFRDELFFDSPDVEFATKLFVNQAFWKPGEQKWMYGVTKQEIQRNFGRNLVYDVIEPKYIRQMIDWCESNNLHYDFKIAYFVNPKNNLAIANARKNMPHDIDVRRENTCNPVDFVHAGLHPDWMMLCSQTETILAKQCMEFIDKTRAR